MQWLYLAFNLAIIAGPFSLSFDRKVAFHRRWLQVGISILLVSTAYLVWDVFATRAGHWHFSTEYAGEFRIAHLPIGEILFFVTVPYACLFVYEVVRAYFRERRGVSVRPVRAAGLVLAALAVVVAVIFRDQGYTVAVMVSVAVMLVVTTLLDPRMWLSTHTLLFFVFSLVLFLLANGVLTAVPIVGYGTRAIWGARVYTIPVEDFLYNFSMLGLYLFVYRAAGRIRARRSAGEGDAG